MENTTLSKEQLALKLAKFSGSGVHKLIANGRRNMTKDELIAEKKSGGKRKTIDIPFGDTAMSYIYEKVAERLTGERKIFKPTAEVYRGIELEPEAKLYLQSAKNITVIENGTDSDENTAWSIDGWVNEFDTGIEIYCPNSDNHLKYIIGEQIDIKVNYPTKYWQILFYCWKHNRDNWKFISYDPRFLKQNHKMVMIDFKVNQEDLRLLKEKVLLAILIFNNIISKLK